MWIKVHISRKLVKAAASAYTSDPVRVFIEYIDNSLDSAEDYFNPIINRYNKEIKVTMEVDRSKNTVKIRDNCRWIPEITKVVTTIWDSDKAKILEKNWQFWFWMFSFMAIAENLSVTSKYESHAAQRIDISEKIFSQWTDDEAMIDEPTTTDYIYDSWTEVIVSNIEKWILKKMDNSKIVEEISKHFEWLLSRENLNIILIDWNVQIPCKKFDYNAYEWDVFEDEIDLKSRWYDDKTNVKIFLKVTEDKQVSRPPFFIIKWRRIIDIKDDKDFLKASAYKKEIWDHPNMIWYIDLWNTVEPRLDRAWFKNDAYTRLIFKEIANREQLIRDMLTKISRETESKHYKNLEDKLTSVLASLAKIDRMNYRKDSASWQWDKITWFQWPVEWMWWDFWFWAQDYSNWNTNDSPEPRSFWTGEWDWFWPNGDPWDIFPWTEPTTEPTTKPHKNYSDFWDEYSGLKTRHKSWFSIKFVDWEPPLDLDNHKIRSTIVWWEIRIYKEHPDFRSRVQIWKNWEDRITQRLITYLAWEITVHYKNEFYCKRSEQPEYNKQMFVELVEFIYKYEDWLKDLVNKNLSDI